MCWSLVFLFILIFFCPILFAFIRFNHSYHMSVNKLTSVWCWWFLVLSSVSCAIGSDLSDGFGYFSILIDSCYDSLSWCSTVFLTKTLSNATWSVIVNENRWIVTKGLWHVNDLETLVITQASYLINAVFLCFWVHDKILWCAVDAKGVLCYKKQSLKNFFRRTMTKTLWKKSE